MPIVDDIVVVPTPIPESRNIDTKSSSSQFDQIFTDTKSAVSIENILRNIDTKSSISHSYQIVIDTKSTISQSDQIFVDTNTSVSIENVLRDIDTKSSVSQFNDNVFVDTKSSVSNFNQIIVDTNIPISQFDQIFTDTKSAVSIENILRNIDTESSISHFNQQFIDTFSRISYKEIDYDIDVPHDVLSDPILVSQFHEDYLSLINFYDDHKRPSTFIKYFNINYDESIRHNDTQSTFDLYNISEIKFDVYDFTPTYNISPIVNSSTNSPERKGQMFDGVTSIVTYTINVPRINDIVVFYEPISAGEIYRVSNIRTPINAYHSDPKATWYEMDLEIAPIKDTSKLKISKHYIYDIEKETYHSYNEYQYKMSVIEALNILISNINNRYSYFYDLYCIDKIVPLCSNFAISYFKEHSTSNDHFVRVFDDLKKPYGFLYRFSNMSPIYSFENPILVYNFDTGLIEEYIWDRTIESNLNSLLLDTENLYNLFVENDNYF